MSEPTVGAPFTHTSSVACVMVGAPCFLLLLTLRRLRGPQTYIHMGRKKEEEEGSCRSLSVSAIPRTYLHGSGGGAAAVRNAEGSGQSYKVQAVITIPELGMTHEITGEIKGSE